MIAIGYFLEFKYPLLLNVKYIQDNNMKVVKMLLVSIRVVWS